MLYWRGVYCIEGDHADMCLNCWQTQHTNKGFYVPILSQQERRDRCALRFFEVCLCCASTHQLEPIMSSCIGPSSWNSLPAYLRTVAFDFCASYISKVKISER